MIKDLSYLFYFQYGHGAYEGKMSPVVGSDMRAAMGKRGGIDCRDAHFNWTRDRNYGSRIISYGTVKHR